MKRSLLVVLAACALAAAAFALPGASARQEGEVPELPGREAWVLKSLNRMLKVEPGMTRADLLKVFDGEGGLSTRTRRTYVYRECRYFKVDVKFEPVGNDDERLAESPEDRIAEISKPYIDYSVSD
jgi:hypothetical protein